MNAHLQKQVLVTGGAGFLGSHLCERLVRDGHRVICLDSLITGYTENLSAIASDTKFQLVRGDVRELALPDVKIDLIFHLACVASPKLYQARPIDTLMTSALGTYNILELAKQKNARTMLASTSEVYGEPKEHPQKETYWGNVNPVGIRSCYDEGKRFAEALGFEYWHHRGQDVRIVRIFNTYGPRMNEHDGRVIPNFASQALRDEPLTIYGDGTQTRSFCYVDDLIDGFMKIMFADDMAGEVFNLGAQEELTINEVARTIIRATGSRSTMHYQPLPDDDPTRRRPDTTKVREALGWEASTSFEAGIEQTIDWYKRTGKL